MGDTGEDSRERIMDATYRALIETGYADLTMNDIAGQSETSTSLLHYHFDTKEDLLVAFLDDLIERIERDLADLADADPVTRLYDVIEWYVLGAGETEREALHTAILELRGQAPYNDRYRERMRQADRLIRNALADIIRDGHESGDFTNGDPETMATLLLATMDGARGRQLAGGKPGYAKAVRAALYEHVLADLFSEEAAEIWSALTGEAEDR